MSNTTKWSDIKNSLNEFSKEDLINLVKDLYNKSSANKMFITARFSDSSTICFEDYQT